jgi:hypothetical protein
VNPGIYEIASELYHGDPAERPSLSSSIARLLCSHSPAHARAAHPKLNPDFKREEEKKFDIGQAAHALFLEGAASVHVVYAQDWRTNAAKESRDEARANGQIPLLVDQWDEVQRMVAATQSQVDEIETNPPLFAEGRPEQTLIWQEDGVICRARLDWLRDDFTAIDDYKTTSASADPA